MPNKDSDRLQALRVRARQRRRAADARHYGLFLRNYLIGEGLLDPETETLALDDSGNIEIRRLTVP